MVKSGYRSTWAESCEPVMVSPVGLYGDILFLKKRVERKKGTHETGQAGAQLVFTGLKAVRHS